MCVLHTHAHWGLGVNEVTLFIDLLRHGVILFDLYLVFIVLSFQKVAFIFHIFCVHFFVFCSRCTFVSWVPEGDGTFVVGHADGNLYVYEKVDPGLNIQFNLVVFDFKFYLKLKLTFVLFV